MRLVQLTVIACAISLGMTSIGLVNIQPALASDTVTSTEVPQICEVEGVWYPAGDSVCPSGAKLTIGPSPALVAYPESFEATVPSSETTSLPQCGYTTKAMTTQFCYPLPQKNEIVGYDNYCVGTAPYISCYSYPVWGLVNQPWNSVPHNVEWTPSASTLTFYQPSTTDTCEPTEQYSNSNYSLSSNLQPCFTSNQDSFTATHLYATVGAYDPTLGVSWNGTLPYTLSVPTTSTLQYQCGFTTTPPAYLGISSCNAQTNYTSATATQWTATSVSTAP